MTERRSATVESVSVRAAGSGDLRLSGYAAVTGVPYEVGFFMETLTPGCFKRTLTEAPDVSLLLQHGVAGTGLPLARSKGASPTLKLSEDGTGLFFEADLDPEDPDSQLLARKLARGDLDGQMSFAFMATSDSWSDDYLERTISACSIHRGDVSVVINAANPAAYSSLMPDAQPRGAYLPPDRTTRIARAQVQQLRDREALRTRRSRR